MIGVEELLEKSRDLEYVDRLIEKYCAHFDVTKEEYRNPAANLAYGLEGIRQSMTIAQATDLMCIALSERAKEVEGHLVCDAVFECLALTFGGPEVAELIKASYMVSKWYA